MKQETRLDSSTRRRFLKTALGAATASALAPLPIRHAMAQEERQPNLLVLVADDQRWDQLGCMGNSIIQTPHIDQLASQGVLFQNNFCSTAICCTSRASLFTGRYGSPLDLHRFDKALPSEAWLNSYPVLLRQAGYRTGFIGKFGIGDPLPIEDFDYWAGFPGQGKYFQEEGKGVHLTRRMGHQALEFLDGCTEDQPFCLSISFKAPHVQDDGIRRLFPPDPADEALYAGTHIPAPKLATEDAWRRMPDFLRESEGHVRWHTRFGTPEMFQSTARDICRLVTGVDRVVGETLNELEERGLRDNTVVVFTSDNGFFFGERQFEGKWLMYEQSIRTPLVIQDPRLPAALRGRAVNPMTLNIDLMPTLVELAGLGVPKTAAGRSLAPLIRGERTEWRKEWFYEHLLNHPRIPRNEGVRTEQWKYIRYLDQEPVYEELYDLESDPHEETNLALEERFRGQLEAMRERWKDLKAKIV